MNNCEKKLDALIDALGFDVERVTTNRDEVEDYKAHRDCVIGSCQVGMIPIGNRPKPKYDYKLTKRANPLDVKYNGVTLRKLTGNIIDIECNPTLSKDDKWIHYNKEQFDAVVHCFGDKAVMDGENKCLIFDVILILDE